MINNNLSDYLVKSKYGKVLQTVLYHQNRLFFEFQKGGFDPRTPPWVLHCFCVSSPLNVSCDHSLEMSMNFPIKKTEEKVSPRPNFKMADYGTICSYLLCVDWNNIIACHGCDI